jgi:arylsulfatase A-like enzyme
MQPGASRTAVTSGKIRNVILLVVESGGASYFDQYGGTYSVSPSLSTPHLQLQNAYAQAVDTVSSMGVLLSSRYPAVTPLAQEPRGPLLPAVLRAHGWSTGFFFSTDIRYRGAGRWIGRSGFDAVRDFRTIPCSDKTIEDVSELNSQATTDACTFAEMKKWIAEKKDHPFFSMLWTFQSHYPYFATGAVPRVRLRSELKDAPEARDSKERYLTALRETDAQIANLLDFLERNQLRDSTLLIVTGDHGEAFLQHGTTGHGYNLYEESVRVPLILISPVFDADQRFERLTGHIDLAPTIVDILGVRSPRGWNGTSIFEARREQPVHFACPWTDLLVGYRYRDAKVEAALLARTAKRYDLRRDPGETVNLAASDDSWQQRQLEALAGWARRQDQPADPR